MRLIAGLAVCALFVAAEGKEPEKAKKPEEGLVGTWKVVEFVHDNKPVNIDKVELRIIFTPRGRIILKNGDRMVNNQGYKADASQKPAAIDFVGSGRAEGSTFAGVYELKGDELKLCWPFGDEERPKVVGPRGSLAFYTLKREKDAKPAAEKKTEKKAEKKEEKSDKP